MITRSSSLAKIISLTKRKIFLSHELLILQFLFPQKNILPLTDGALLFLDLLPWKKQEEVWVS